jgi:mono/diheme cytochrome c family protein
MVMKISLLPPALGVGFLAVSALVFSAGAQIGLPRNLLPQQGGEAIYKGVCQACHMPTAHGAVGAGIYPALAGNSKLEGAGYPVSVVIHGQKAMPAFGDVLSDQQIADLVNYIRTHFGNDYKDTVTPADVRSAR